MLRLPLLLLLGACASASSVGFLSRKDRHLLSVRLQSKADAVLAKWNATHLKEDLFVIGDGVYKLAESLTCAYFRRSTFVIGITGGSSTQGSFAWPYLLQNLLRNEFNMSTELQNAAQGSTGQIITAPCINALLGDKIDLLMWEFAMNTQPNTNINNDPAYVESHRVLGAETWIRAAVGKNPAAIGFLHLWDIRIHDWERGQKP